jgi:predicted nucleic acid-binding protein
VSCEPEIIERAAQLKAVGGLSVADAWIAATALLRGARLVHKDPEFDTVQKLQHERLPD